LPKCARHVPPGVFREHLQPKHALYPIGRDCHSGASDRQT
jgi:hypothetical protein